MRDVVRETVLSMCHFLVIADLHYLWALACPTLYAPQSNVHTLSGPYVHHSMCTTLGAPICAPPCTRLGAQPYVRTYVHNPM